jgi:hypothetical protein
MSLEPHTPHSDAQSPKPFISVGPTPPSTGPGTSLRRAPSERAPWNLCPLERLGPSETGCYALFQNWERRQCKP